MDTNRIILAPVKGDWRSLEFAAESCRGDRAIVVAAVQQNGSALQFASSSCRGDHELVLASVKQNGLALEFAAENCRGDREVVLAAAKQNGLALEFADKNCSGDREVVLAAVKQNGRALQFAAESYRGDREVVLAAIENVRKGQEALALQLASDELLEDSSFAIEAKMMFRILKISMISGRRAIVLSPTFDDLNTAEVLGVCCAKLGVGFFGSMRLVSGSDVVPDRTVVADWPGIRACGEISEYQLVVQQS